MDTLSGCNTVYHYQGIGYKTVIKVFQKQPLIHFLDCHLMMEEVITEVNLFLGLFYRIITGIAIPEKR